MYFSQGAAWSLVAMGVVCLWGLQKTIGYLRALMLLTVLGLCALVFEYTSIHTGFPYGYFLYSNKLGFKLLETVPWTVFLGWTPLVIGSVALSQRVCDSRWLRILVATFFLVLIDFVFDPVAVALGFWSWNHPGAYFGVPLVNFFGWIFSGLLGSWFTVHTVRQTVLSRVAIIPCLLLLCTSIICALVFHFWIPFFLGSILLFLFVFLQTSFSKKITAGR